MKQLEGLHALRSLVFKPSADLAYGDRVAILRARFGLNQSDDPMAKFFTRKADDSKERSEVEKQSNQNRNGWTPAEPTAPYETHRQGPLTYFNCNVEDIKKLHQAAKSPKPSARSRSLLRGLVGLGLLAGVLGVGLAVIHFSSQRSQPLPKITPSSPSSSEGLRKVLISTLGCNVG